MSHVADLDILAEEEADRQRVVEETELEQYIRAVKQKQAEAERAYEEEQRVLTEEQQREACTALASGLNAVLRLEVPVGRVRIERPEDFNQWFPAVEFGGVTFARPYHARNGVSYRERQAIHVARPCADCGRTMWVYADSAESLVSALEKEGRHEFACRQQFDEDGEPVTDRFGNELPVRAPREPVITAEDQYHNAARLYRALVKQRRTMEFQRPIEKAAACKRLLDAKLATSATAAKEMAHTDPDFAQFCEALTNTVVAEMEAREALLVARKNAGLSGAGTSVGGEHEEDAA